jgi:hypothetical protein
MTSREYKSVIACLDEALNVPSTSLNRVGDVSFRADLVRTRAKAAQEMVKAGAREHTAALVLQSGPA